MKQADWVVYGLRLRNDDEYRYVGQTAWGAEYRLKGHLDESRRSITPLGKWIRKYPNQIVVDIIEQCTPENIDFREQFWIATFRDQHRLGIKHKDMLNIMDGGRTQRTWDWTPEQRAKVSARVSGEGNPMYGRRGPEAPCWGRSGELHPMFGTHHSDEAKAKISAAAKGKPKSEATRTKMRTAQQLRSASGESSAQAKKNMHNRWHVRRGIIKDTCEFCS